MSLAEELSVLDNLLFPGEGWNEYTLSKELEAGRYFIRKKESKIVGYAITRKQEDLRDLMRIGVHPDAQGQGVGSSLLSEILSDGYPTILFVRKHNKRAMALYKRHGFRITGCTSESWLMRRDKTQIDFVEKTAPQP